MWFMLRGLALCVVLLLGCSGPEETSAGAADDRLLTQGDIECSSEVLGDTEQTQMLVAHYVVNGALGDVCFGEQDPTLLRAFEELAIITPPGQLNDLGLFAGFAWNGGDDETLAFVAPIDDDGAQFVMAVGLDSYDTDPDQAKLTMAHEFSHVFTETISQIDRSADPDACRTHWNGSGCYTNGSLMAAWIEQFWSDDLLSNVNVDIEVTTEDGEQRCAINDSFFGTYAATTPEEDFAEAFSAYVYDLEAKTDGQQAKLDWLADQPGLVEFRERADNAGLTPLDNTFDTCGRS